MNNDRDQEEHGNASSGLGWPLVSAFGLSLAAIVAVSLAGGDTAPVERTIGLVLGGLGAAGGIGAWVNSTRAARQTNGVLDQRMAAAVERGIAARFGTDVPPVPATSEQATRGRRDDTEWPEPIPSSIP